MGRFPIFDLLRRCIHLISDLVHVQREFLVELRLGLFIATDKVLAKLFIEATMKHINQTS